MGYDIYGKNPKTDAGKYFQRNVSGWEPLAELVIEYAPDLAKQCEAWFSNDGEGLNGNQASALAQTLEAGMQNGTLSEYMATRERKLECLPKEVCNACDGTGVRTQVSDYFASLCKEDGERSESCGFCEGRGWSRSKPSLKSEEIAEWIAFLKNCGGFEIW